MALSALGFVGPGQGSGRVVVKAGCEQQPQELSLVLQAVRPGWVRVVLC